MQLPTPLHPWQVSPKEAIHIQKQLVHKIKIIKPPHAIHLIAGVDAAFSPDKTKCIAAVVLWDRATQKVVEQHVAVGPVYFPYIPGLLSFREIPALLSALSQLTLTPDVIMCDGHGLAHPRKLGIATHLGIFTDLTTFGCGKSKLVGQYVEPEKIRGEKSPLTYKGEVIGTVLRTKNNTKPVFISVGHKIDLATAEEIAFESALGYRLPEPTRLADRLVAQAKLTRIC
jgi:deoxyribonuclease V